MFCCGRVLPKHFFKKMLKEQRNLEELNSVTTAKLKQTPNLLKALLPNRIKKNLPYTGLTLKYANTTWSSIVSNTSTNKPQAIQNPAWCIVTG